MWLHKRERMLMQAYFSLFTTTSCYCSHSPQISFDPPSTPLFWFLVLFASWLVEICLHRPHTQGCRVYFRVEPLTQLHSPWQWLCLVNLLDASCQFKTQTPLSPSHEKVHLIGTFSFIPFLLIKILGSHVLQ